jgi:3-polyprenyl-4-hydroxybenzoate decarboxylase
MGAGIPRFDPIRDTVIIPCMNTMTVDPMIAKDDPPATISKIGFDCTIPWGEKWVRLDFQRSAPFELGVPPAGVLSMTEDGHRKGNGVIYSQRAPVMEGNPAALQGAKLPRCLSRFRTAALPPGPRCTAALLSLRVQ